MSNNIILEGMVQELTLTRNARIYPEFDYSLLIKQYAIKRQKMDRQKKISMINERSSK